MPETEPKITVQAKQHLQIHTCVENLIKHLKWSNKELLAKNISQRHCNISERDLNTVKLLKYARDRESSEYE